MRPPARPAGAVGNDIDKQERREKDFQQAQALAAAQVQQQRLGLTDVVHMAQQGHDDQVIINQIRSSGSTFQLAPSDLDYLKNNGVSARVIAEMQAARASHSGGSWTARADHCDLRCSLPSPSLHPASASGCVSLPAVLWWLLPPLVSSQSSRTNSRPAGRL